MRSPENEQIAATFKRILRRRRRLVIASFVAVLAAVILYNELSTPQYEATTSFVFDEFAPAVATAPAPVAEETRLANRLAEIGSYTMAEAVADSLPAATRARIEAWENPGPGADLRRHVAAHIQTSLLAQSLPGSNIVRVGVRMRDPEVAMIVANTLADVMHARSLETKQAGMSGARAFIENQLQRYEEQLATSEQELMLFKQRNSLTSFDDEAKEVLRRSTEAEVLYNNAVANRQSTVNRLAEVEKELDQQKRDLVPKVTDIGTPWALRLQQKLVDLQTEYQDLKVQGYPIDHPRLLQLDHDIAETKQILTSEAQKLAAGQVALDPLTRIDKYFNDAISLRMEIVSLGAQEAALKRVIDGYDQRLGNLPSQEFGLVRMTRDRDVNQKIYTMLQEKLQQARISEAEQRPDFRTIDRALKPLAPVKPNKPVNLALGGLFGILLGLGLAFAREGFASSVDSTQRFERLAGRRVLGSIPRVDRVPAGDEPLPTSAAVRREQRQMRRALLAHHDPSGGSAEAYRILRTNLQFAGFGDKSQILLVSSMLPGEGKTTTISNLAIAMAELGYPTLVIDGEIRKPGMHATFRVPQTPGVTEILQGMFDKPGTNGARPWREVEEPSELGGEKRDGAAAATSPRVLKDYSPVLHPTFIPNLTVVSSGAAGIESAQSLAVDPQRLRDFFDSMRARFRYILIDTPPLMLVHDVAFLANLVDAVLLVVDSRSVDKEMLATTRSTLENARANVVGVVLNNVEPIGVYKKNSYYTT